MLTCPDCGQPYTANSGHCRGGAFTGCCKSFASTGGFDAHRTGSGDTRRCRTTDEMLEAGWSQNGVYWAKPQTGEIPEAWRESHRAAG